MLDDKTSVIIIGRPSGTAMTITATLNVSPYKRCGNIFLNVNILLISKLFATTTELNKYEINIKKAHMYPSLLICLASILSLYFNGLSIVLSCISWAILP